MKNSILFMIIVSLFVSCFLFNCEAEKAIKSMEPVFEVSEEVLKFKNEHQRWPLDAAELEVYIFLNNDSLSLTKFDKLVFIQKPDSSLIIDYTLSPPLMGKGGFELEWSAKTAAK